MEFERQYFYGDTDWKRVSRETVKKAFSAWFLDAAASVIEGLEISARANAPQPGDEIFTDVAAYRATATATATGGEDGDGRETRKE